MTDDFALNERALAWIDAIRAHYRGEPLEAAPAAPVPPVGAFKIL